MDYLRAGCASEEKGSFGIFDALGSFLVEGSFGASIARLSKYQLAIGHIDRNMHLYYLHLSQHCAVVIMELGCRNSLSQKFDIENSQSIKKVS